jgi:Flp pilus assembly pilin Flp
MLQRARRFAIELHEDESGPNTVEWILLIIVALVILVGIYAFVNWAFGQIEAKKSEVENPDIGI